MLTLLSAIDLSNVNNIISIAVSILTFLGVPSVITLLVKKHKEKKEKEEQEKLAQQAEQEKLNKAKETAINFLDNQKVRISSISNGLSANNSNLSDMRDFGITRQLTSDEIKKNENDAKEKKPATYSITKYEIGGFIEKLLEEKRALVVGDAGQGKSVFMKRVCEKMSEADSHYKSKESKRIFPIYIEIKNVVAELKESHPNNWVNADLVKCIFDSVGLDYNAFDYISKNYEICYIFDAMDEVSPEDFNKFQTLVADSLNNAYMVFSSRPGQASISGNVEMKLSDQPIRKWVLDEISDEALGGFLNNNDLYNKIIEAENRDSKYKKLSRNPLLVSLIKKVYEVQNALPNSKVQLFDHVIRQLIDRDINGDNSVDKTEVIKILGEVAYEQYKRKDGTTNDPRSIKQLLREIISDYDNCDHTLANFFEHHNFIDESGFKHELFASYYCAYFLYKCVCDGGNDRFKEVANDINKQADYWKEVIINLICLIEQSAQRKINDTQEQRAKITERLKLLLTMLKTMQGLNEYYLIDENPLVDNPDYDVLCEAVSQFIDIKTNKPCAEEVLIKGMLVRGEMGINSYDTATYKVEKGANPYEELFYYTVLYDFRDGLSRIYNKEKPEEGEKALSAIQRHLFNELCEVQHCNFVLSVTSPLGEELINKLTLASGINNRTKGHMVLYPNLFSIFNLRDITSIKVSSNLIIDFDFDFNHFRPLNPSKLSRIIVDKNNTFYRAEKDCLINRMSNTLVLGCKNSVIPNSVTSIMWRAFKGCTSLTSITLPDRVASN